MPASSPDTHDHGAISGHLAALASAAVYAVGLIGQKVLAADFSIASVALWQFGTAAIVLWAITLATDGLRGPSVRSFVLPLIWGVVAPGASLMINMLASRHTDGVTMMLVWGFLPLVAPLISPLLIGERLRLDVLAGAALTLAGVAIGASFRQAEGWTTLQGVALTSAAVMMAGCGFVLGRFINRAGGTWRRSAALQITGAALVALAFTMVDGDARAFPDQAGAGHVAILVYLILVMTVLNFLIFNYALAVVPVALVSLYSALAPVFGAAAAWIWLGDAMTLVDLATFGLVVVGVALPNVLQLRRRARNPDPSSLH